MVRERRGLGEGRGGGGCVGCVTIRSCPYKVYLRLDSLLVAVPSPDGETEARERLRKPDTNRVPQRLFIMFFCDTICFFVYYVLRI